VSASEQHLHISRPLVPIPLFFVLVFTLIQKTAKNSISSVRSLYPFILPSVRLEEFGCSWTNIDKIWLLKTFRKYVELLKNVWK